MVRDKSEGIHSIFIIILEPVFSPVITSVMPITKDSIYIEWMYDSKYYLSIELDSFLVEVTDVQSTYYWSLLVENSARKYACIM